MLNHCLPMSPKKICHYCSQLSPLADFTVYTEMWGNRSIHHEFQGQYSETHFYLSKIDFFGCCPQILQSSWKTFERWCNVQHKLWGKAFSYICHWLNQLCLYTCYTITNAYIIIYVNDLWPHNLWPKGEVRFHCNIIWSHFRQNGTCQISLSCQMCHLFSHISSLPKHKSLPCQEFAKSSNYRDLLWSLAF